MLALKRLNNKYQLWQTNWHDVVSHAHLVAHKGELV